MSIQIKSAVPQGYFKFVVLAVFAMILMSLWGSLQARVAGLRYQEVLGEQKPSTSTALRDDLYALPIVLAKSDHISDSDDGVTDAEIEAAFRKPEPEIVVDQQVEAPDQKPVSNIIAFRARFRPVINGVSSDGAIVDGSFWSIGEPIVNLRFHSSFGEVITPRLAYSSSNGVTLKLGDEFLSIPFTGG